MGIVFLCESQRALTPFLRLRWDGCTWGCTPASPVGVCTGACEHVQEQERKMGETFQQVLLR